MRRCIFQLQEIHCLNLYIKSTQFFPTGVPKYFWTDCIDFSLRLVPNFPCLSPQSNQPMTLFFRPPPASFAIPAASSTTGSYSAGGQTSVLMKRSCWTSAGSVTCNHPNTPGPKASPSPSHSVTRRRDRGRQ